MRLEPCCVKSDKMGLYYVHFLKVMRVILSVYLSVFFPYFDRSYSLSVFNDLARLVFPPTLQLL